MSKKVYFDWTDDKKYTLAQLALKYKGYKKTEMTLEEKWATILEKLKLKPGFEELIYEVDEFILSMLMVRLHTTVHQDAIHEFLDLKLLRISQSISLS